MSRKGIRVWATLGLPGICRIAPNPWTVLGLNPEGLKHPGRQPLRRTKRTRPRQRRAKQKAIKIAHSERNKKSLAQRNSFLALPPSPARRPAVGFRRLQVQRFQARLVAGLRRISQAAVPRKPAATLAQGRVYRQVLHFFGWSLWLSTT